MRGSEGGVRLGAGAGTQIKVKVASGLDPGGMQDGDQRKGREGFPLPPFSDFSSHKNKKAHLPRIEQRNF